MDGRPPKLALDTPFDVFAEDGVLRLTKGNRPDVLVRSPDRITLEEWRLTLRGISAETAKPPPSPGNHHHLPWPRTASASWYI